MKGGRTRAAFRTSTELLENFVRRTKNDALYDDRLVRMLRGIRVDPKLDVRELLFQRTSTTAVYPDRDAPHSVQ